jgi:hypothetical protein
MKWEIIHNNKCYYSSAIPQVYNHKHLTKKMLHCSTAFKQEDSKIYTSQNFEKISYKSKAINHAWYDCSHVCCNDVI